MPSPYFTPRTANPLMSGQVVANQSPKACQPFDVVWNVCNAGAVTSNATSYTVTLKEDVPPNGNPGLNTTVPISLPSLAPCACNTQSFVSSTGLDCADSSLTPRAVRISTSLSSLYTGTFTIQQP
jgi:hypothetical protein